MRARPGKSKRTGTQEIASVKCPVCGKTFVPAPMHVYRMPGAIDGARVCSYSCMLKAEDGYEERQKEKRIQAQKRRRERERLMREVK